MTRFTDQNLNLDRDALVSKRKVRPSRSIKRRAYNVMPVDGDSPYAEYLPARFKQYQNPQAMYEEEKTR